MNKAHSVCRLMEPLVEIESRSVLDRNRINDVTQIAFIIIEYSPVSHRQASLEKIPSF